MAGSIRGLRLAEQLLSGAIADASALQTRLGTAAEIAAFRMLLESYAFKAVAQSAAAMAVVTGSALAMTAVAASDGGPKRVAASLVAMAATAASQTAMDKIVLNGRALGAILSSPYADATILYGAGNYTILATAVTNGGASSKLKRQTFLASGVFTPPVSGAKQVRVFASGAGGGNAAVVSNATSTGGGGGGQYRAAHLGTILETQAVTVGTTYGANSSFGGKLTALGGGNITNGSTVPGAGGGAGQSQVGTHASIPTYNITGMVWAPSELNLPGGTGGTGSSEAGGGGGGGGGGNGGDGNSTTKAGGGGGGKGLNGSAGASSIGGAGAGGGAGGGGGGSTQAVGGAGGGSSTGETASTAATAGTGGTAGAASTGFGGGGGGNGGATTSTANAGGFGGGGAGGAEQTSAPPAGAGFVHVMWVEE